MKWIRIWIFRHFVDNFLNECRGTKALLDSSFPSQRPFSSLLIPLFVKSSRTVVCQLLLITVTHGQTPPRAVLDVKEACQGALDGLELKASGRGEERRDNRRDWTERRVAEFLQSG
jgi:hypothetical protein